MNPACFVIEHNGLKMAVKRYRTHTGSAPPTKNELTLFFTHGIGLVKEQWEPIIASLLSTRMPLIREVWAFDWQNHGDSAILNEEVIKIRELRINVKTWGEAIAAFMRSEHVRGHRIVAIGHSAGASAIMHSTLSMSSQDSPRYHAIILIEPPMVEPEVLKTYDEEHTAIIEFLSQAISARRNAWNSRTTAYEYLQKRLPWNGWDERALRLFVEHGLQDAVDEKGATCVGLKCPREQEAAMYWEYPVNFDGINVLDKVLRLIPVHVIFAENAPPSPEFVHDSAVEMCKKRGIPVTHLEGVRHLVPQEAPDLLAKTLTRIFPDISCQLPPVSKL